ncbi:MAG: enoyl-ACP reductase [Bacillota bacterium]
MLEGKTGVVFGVANNHSLAWSITKALDSAGAGLAISCQGERFINKIQKLTAEHLKNKPLLLACDVQDEQQIARLYEQIDAAFGRLDFLVHSIAFASREDLEGTFLQTSRDGFRLAMEISVYSLLAVTRLAIPLMREGGSIITLTYLGSRRFMPHYNVMGVAKAALESAVRYLAGELGPQGIRVNALSAGPVNTLSARGIRDFSSFLHTAAAKAPLQRNISGEEVGDATLFLCSDLSRGITGEIIYVDAGFHITGT